MKSRTLSWGLRLAVILLLAAGTGVLAQGPVPFHFHGSINDYTPQTISGKAVGPWEMHGTWSLDVKGRSGFADFSADMTMQLSDHAMDVAIANGTVTNGVLTTFDDTSTRIPHTHHVTMKNGTVSNVTGSCPAYLPPATTNPGFMVTGMVTITGNGGPAPFSKGDTVLSPLQVCVNGGTDVPFSNVSLVFGSPASGHFGVQAIHGVVHKPKLIDFEFDHQ